MPNIKKGIQSFYSTAQVQAYLQRINYPTLDVSSFRTNLTNLELLVRLHLLAFPFENSRLHYSANHEVDVTPQATYKRLVEHRQGGSWCYGQNGLLLGILRGLGYRAYSAPARVNKNFGNTSGEVDYTGLVHLVLIMQLDNGPTDSLNQHATTTGNSEKCEQATYLVDVGFGGAGLVRPIRLKVEQTVLGSAPPEEHRLMRTAHPQSSLEEDESSLEWALQYRCGSHQPKWTTLYLFFEYEIYPEDWIASSQWLSQHPPETFNTVIVIRHFVIGGDSAEDKGYDALLGRLILVDTRVQRRIGEQSVTIKEFITERERLQTLKDDFDITVDEDEASNIFDSPAKLPMQ